MRAAGRRDRRREYRCGSERRVALWLQHGLRRRTPRVGKKTPNQRESRSDFRGRWIGACRSVCTVARRSYRRNLCPARESRERAGAGRSEEHTSELQSQSNLVCRLLLEKKKNKYNTNICTLQNTLTLTRHTT